MAIKKKKKKEELDASLMGWYLPGSLSPVTVRTPALGNRIYTSLPFEVDIWGQRQVFNLLAYLIYGSFLPTPLEQIAFARDPLGIVPPYEWRGIFYATLDASALVRDPVGIISSEFHKSITYGNVSNQTDFWNSEQGILIQEAWWESGVGTQV